MKSPKLKSREKSDQNESEIKISLENEIEKCFAWRINKSSFILRENENKSIKMNSDVSEQRKKNGSEWFESR